MTMMAAMKGKAKGAAKAEKPSGGGGGGGGGPSFEDLFSAVTEKFGAMRAPIENQVYVQNLPSDTTDLSLYRLFSPFGAIAPNGVRAMLAPDGTCRGFGFVDFVQEEAASVAVMQLNGFEGPDGMPIQCSIKQASGKGRGKKKRGRNTMMHDALLGDLGGWGIFLMRDRNR